MSSCQAAGLARTCWRFRSPRSPRSTVLSGSARRTNNLNVWWSPKTRGWFREGFIVGLLKGDSGCFQKTHQCSPKVFQNPRKAFQANAGKLSISADVEFQKHGQTLKATCIAGVCLFHQGPKVILLPEPFQRCSLQVGRLLTQVQPSPSIGQPAWCIVTNASEYRIQQLKMKKYKPANLNPFNSFLSSFLNCFFFPPNFPMVSPQPPSPSTWQCNGTAMALAAMAALCAFRSSCWTSTRPRPSPLLRRSRDSRFSSSRAARVWRWGEVGRKILSTALYIAYMCREREID